MNVVVLIGNLTRDPDLRYTTNGKAVCKFTLAVDREYNNRVGDDEHDSLYVDVLGQVHYYNLQTGDGSNGGYRFMPSDCGELEVRE